MNPTVGRIVDVDRLGHGVHTFPLGGGNAAIHGLRPVVGGVALGYEVAVPVGDVSLGVGIDGIVGGVFQNIHRPLVVGEAPRLGALPALDEHIHRAVVRAQTLPLPVALGHHRAVVGVVGLYLFFLQLAVFSIGQGNVSLAHGAFFSLVHINPTVAFL